MSRFLGHYRFIRSGAKLDSQAVDPLLELRIVVVESKPRLFV
jgi:hypothetical protein